MPWWQCLSSTPTDANPVWLTPTSPTHMISVGFLPKSSSFMESCTHRENLDQDWYKYIDKIGFKYNDDEYHVSNPTHSGVHKAALKFDTFIVEPSDIDEPIHKQTFGDLCDFFEPLRDSCPIKELVDVEYNPDATVALCGEILGSRTKDDMVLHNWDSIELFWERAHLINQMTLWKLFGKVEFLKKAKLENRDIRSILTIPVELFFSTAAMCQSMNEKMCEPTFFKTTPSKHGIDLLKGGFSELLRTLTFSKPFHVIQGDCSKWDSRCMPFLLEMCKKLRYHCWDKKNMSPKEWHQRMDYYYGEIIRTYFYTPSGEVFMKNLGQPSGTVSTTDDNIIMHLYVLCYAWRKLFGRSLFIDYHDHVRMAIYADDHLFTVSDDRRAFCSFETRRTIYEHFGLILKLDDDKVSQTFEGHTFLGLTAKNEYGKFVPTFKRERILNAVGKFPVGKRLDPVQRYERAMVYTLLATFDGPCFEVMQKFCVLLRGKYSELSHKILWSQDNCRAMWLGWENNQDMSESEKEGIKLKLRFQGVPQSILQNVDNTHRGNEECAPTEEATITKRTREENYRHTEEWKTCGDFDHTPAPDTRGPGRKS